MKKFFILIATISLGLLFAGCAKEYDDSAIKGDIKTLQEQVKKIQDDIQSLNGQVSGLVETINQWKSGGYVESIQELADKSGFTITFVGGKTVTLYHGAKGDKGDPGEPGAPGTPGSNGSNGTNGTNGENGKTPTLKMDTDNVFYWAIDNDFILVDGKKVPATVVPSFAINEAGDLIMTIAGQEINLGHVVGEGGPADSLFESIVPGDGVITFTLKGGETFSIPLAKAFKLVIEEPVMEVTAGQVVEIAYKVENGNEETVVDCFAGGNYQAIIADGKVKVTVPDPFAEGQVLVWAQNNKGLFSMVKLQFTVKAEVVIVTPEAEYQAIPADQDSYIINVTSNVDVDVKLPEEATWLSAVVTKASYKLTLTLEPNNTGEPREAEINIVRKDNGQTVQTIKIVQLSTAKELGIFDSNITWTLGEKAYDKYTQNYLGYLDVTYNGETYTSVDHVKLGTASKPGNATFKIPQGTVYVSFWAVAWNDKNTTLKIGEPLNKEIVLEKREGVKGASDATQSYIMTPTVTDADCYAINLGTPLPADVEIKVETVANPGVRAVLFGLQASDEAPVEPVKVVKVEKLWEKLSTADANWMAAFGGTPGTDFNIAIDDKNVYVPEFGGSKKLWAIDIATGETVKEVNTTTVESKGFDGSIFLSCARVVKKNDGTPVLMASNLFQDGDSDNPTGRLYVWENGIDAAPAVKTLQSWGAGRRLGDTWTTYGNYEDCWMIMGTQTGNGFVTFRVPTGNQSYLISRLAIETTDFCSYYPFPGEITKGMFTWRGGNHDDGLAYRNRLMTVNSTETAIKTEGAHTSELSKLGTWMGNYENNNGSGFNYIEFNGKRYVIWVINMADGKTFDIVIKEGDAATPWQTIIDTKAADITAAGGFAFRESLGGGQAVTWKQGTDCAVWNNGDEVYIAVNKVNVGIAVYKLYLGNAE